MSQFFASCGQSIGVSASASVLPININIICSLVKWRGHRESVGLLIVYYLSDIPFSSIFSDEMESLTSSHLDVSMLGKFCLEDCYTNTGCLSSLELVLKLQVAECWLKIPE